MILEAESVEPLTPAFAPGGDRIVLWFRSVNRGTILSPAAAKKPSGGLGAIPTLPCFVVDADGTGLERITPEDDLLYVTPNWRRAN